MLDAGPGVISTVFLNGDGRSGSEFIHAIGRVGRFALPALLVVTIIFALIEGQRYSWGTVWSWITTTR